MESPPLPDWPARLRAQGRSMTWLASQVDVSRTYLADVAAGRKHASPELAERITLALRVAPDRLGTIHGYAAERARWIEVRKAALALAASITAALGDGPQ
jgi:Helix-turn-helix